MQSSTKVAYNTGILYARMLLTVGISLYSTRIVLGALGATDYGIFNLVAGVIAMLSFLNAAMATSTQRYLSYHQGREDMEMQKKVFTNSLLLHVLIGISVVASLEIAGLFLFDGFLNIPANRVDTAKVIFHFMSATVFFTIVAVPFNGSLIAHENMLWVAVVNIAETLLKLGIALLLIAVTTDKLVVYGLLTAGVSVVSFLMYALFCFSKYEECTLRNVGAVDRRLLRELGSFAGWNLFGSLCGVGRTQGLAILLNLFLGTVVNAAYAIANQVSAQLNFFSATMLRAINPQIMKSEGQGDRNRMLRLSMIASKFSFFLLAIVAIPCLFEMPYILHLWLKDVPDYTVQFCRFMLLGMLVNQVTIGLQSGLQATGNIKFYQIVVGTTVLLNLPLAYVLLYVKLPPYFVLISYVSIEVVACMLRISFLRKTGGLKVMDFLKRVVVKELIPVAASVIVCALSGMVFSFEYRFLLTIAISATAFIIAIYTCGLCEDEQLMVDNMLLKAKNKILRTHEATVL